MLRARDWEEPLRDRSIEVIIAAFPTGQRLLQFWVVPKSGRGCTLFGQRGLSHTGRPLMQDVWRYDADLRIPGALDLPSEVFPNMGIPGPAFLHALDAPRVGSTGAVNQLISPYGYIRLDVWGDRVEPVKVPAGDFSSLVVVMRPDVKSIMRTWLTAVQKIVQPIRSAVSSAQDRRANLISRTGDRYRAAQLPPRTDSRVATRIPRAALKRGSSP